MIDEQQHALTLQLLQEISDVLKGESRETVLNQHDSIQRLLSVHDEKDAREIAREMLRDALSL
jgi:DNA-binding FadR family transcriptional regulator